jgi:hypothetical protein
LAASVCATLIGSGLRIAPPSDFRVDDQADPNALIEVDGWASRTKCVPSMVGSSIDTETRASATMAVLECAQPLPRRATRDQAAATEAVAPLAAAIDAALGPADFVEIIETSGHPTIHAAWSSDSRDTEILLAPTGTTSALLIVRGDPRARARWERTFDDAIASSEGIAASTRTLRPERIRAFGFAGVLASALALHGLFLALADRRGDHRGASVRAAAVLALLSAAAAATVYFVLGRTAEVDPTGFGLSRIAIELLAAGLSTGVMMVLVARFFVPDARIRSAPEPATSPLLRPGVPRAVDSDAPLEDLYRSRD